MSSSKKKQLRKEQLMTERQLAAAKEAKQLKRYTVTFWIVIALVLATFVGALSLNPIKNVIYNNSDAITIGDHTLSAVEANYFFMDAVNAYTSQYGDYISLFMDTKTPLNKQIIDAKTGKTWADSFLDTAKENIKVNYGLYDAAKKDGFKLTEEQQKSIDSSMSNLEIYAKRYGYSNADTYVRAIYGSGASVKTYKEYYTVSMIASLYASAHSDSLEYTDAQVREFEAGSAFKYNSYTYASYYLPVTSFYTGGTKDDKGGITYSAAEKKAGLEACKAAAEALAAGTYETTVEFDAAISALEINKGKTVSSTKNSDVLYSSISSLFQDWVIGRVPAEKEGEDDTFVERKPGDQTVIEYTSGSGDSATVNGYYVLRYMSSSDNVVALKNVRHILIAFEGGTKDTNGNTVYSTAEKEAAKKKAEKLLLDWKAGAMTEDSFKALVKDNSSDAGSVNNGGLYEDIYPGQMVTAFENWCFDETRKAGDTGLVETEYGYHIMYFVSNSELTYRDMMIKSDMRAEDMQKWQDKLTENVKVNVVDTKYINMGLTLGGHSH